MERDSRTSPGQRHLLARLHQTTEELAGSLHDRLATKGYGDIRPGHGCVFGNIDPDGSRLTDIATRAGYTKQAVGEVVSDLEQLGYAERVPDPADRRAKIIRLTEKGRSAQATGFRTIQEIEEEWADRYGEDRIAALRELLDEILGDPAALAA
jgi:DNA-binding MarR family transcriptional regulator